MLFGWLTKGHYDVSLLDRIICISEFAVLITVIVLITVSYYKIKNWLKK